LPAGSPVAGRQSNWKLEANPRRQPANGSQVDTAVGKLMRLGADWRTRGGIEDAWLRPEAGTMVMR